MRDDDPIPDLKRQLGSELSAHVTGWNGDDIGSVLGTDRSRIADLRNGKLDRFSLETLIRFATRLRLHVELKTSAPPRNVRGRKGIE